MRAPHTSRARRSAGAAAALSLALLVGGCATVGSLLGGYRDAHRSAARGGGDGWLRAALERGSYDSALVRLTSGPDAPADALLRALYSGTVAHYAMNHAASARALAQANAIAEDRYTKSVSRAGVSLLTSDVAMPYAAGRTERLLVHYYGVLGYLRQDSTAAAAVEARRLSKLLELYGEGRAPEEAATHAMLHYVAGVAFDAAGERASAGVAYRNAAALARDPAPGRTAERAPARRARGRRVLASAPTGEVVVVLEQGFIGRRAEESGTLGFDSSEVAGLATGDSGATVLVNRRFPGAAAAPAGPPAPEVVVLAHDIPRRGTALPRPMDARPASPAHPATVAPAAPGYFLRIAWPTFVREPRAVAPLGVVVVAGSVRPPPVALRFRADLSDAAERDFERQRAALVARAASRAAAKYWATRMAAKKGGAVGGAVANAATALLERADTRSWHLLPGTVSIARLTLPPGVHDLALEIPTAGGPPLRIPVGQVTVTADRVAVLSKRLWSNAPVAPAQAAAHGVI